MKKLFIILLSGALLSACGGNEGETKSEDTTPANTETTAPQGDAASNDRGLELIGSSDCTACHSIDRKLIGPAYVDVAKKYEPTQANIDTLVSKIKNGGMGNWGNVPMTPHPDLPDADAREMVNYILSLRNQ